MDTFLKLVVAEEIDAAFFELPASVDAISSRHRGRKPRIHVTTEFSLSFQAAFEKLRDVFCFLLQVLMGVFLYEKSVLLIIHRLTSDIDRLELPSYGL